VILGLTACHRSAHLDASPAVRVDQSTVSTHAVNLLNPLRLSKAEWAILNKEPCGGEHYLEYDLTVSALGVVESAALLPYDGSCDFVADSPEPPPVVSSHLSQAESILRAQRFAPWIVDGHPARIVVRTSVGLAPPERFGPQRTLPALASGDDFSMSLERRGCEGRCPVYTVAVSGNGAVTYNGFAYVATKGIQRDHISTQAAMELLNRFRQANFQSALPLYSGEFDGGYDVLTLRIGERQYQVVDETGLEVGLPNAILNLEEAIDKATQSARWVGGRQVG